MQLLRFTTIPIKYQLSVERARLEISQKNMQAEITRTGGELDIQSQPPKLNVDTFERRKSMGLKSARSSNEEFADLGLRAASEATANYADLGNEIIHIERGANIPDALFAQYFQRATAGELVFIPLSPSEISFTPGSLQMNYTPVKLDFNWQGGKAQLDYIPGGVKMEITQYPQLQIEYLGKPNYVPPSAAKRFEAIA